MQTLLEAWLPPGESAVSGKTATLKTQCFIPMNPGGLETPANQNCVQGPALEGSSHDQTGAHTGGRHCRQWLNLLYH